MSGGKVTPEHLARSACLYIRQSTMQQVFGHRESRERQYALKSRALKLGWTKDQVQIIDHDQGISGTSTRDRAGFQHLVAEVGLGKVGLVMGLEVSRLARNNADWHRLLEICGMTETLILDEDGLYSPSDFNDRLLLGLKGAMSEAELHFIRARLNGGKLNKAKRGELKFPLTIGYIHDPEGRIVLDPDAQVRKAVSHLFATFERVGSAYGVVKHFRENDLTIPSHIQHGPNAGGVLWQPPTNPRVIDILHNPIYAGAYVYGRTRSWKDPLTGKRRMKRLPQEEWKVFIPNAHEGYISWEVYQRNQKRLAGNTSICKNGRQRTPPRCGPALLQGLIICGVCGQRMMVKYNSKAGKLIPRYRCQHTGNLTSRPICQSIQGPRVEAAIGRLVMTVVSPLSVEASMAVYDEIRRRHDEVVQLHQTRVVRARQEAELARQRFLAVSPANRLVADSLEVEWNDALRAVTSAEDEYEQILATHPSTLNEDEVARIRQLAEDFPRVWNDPSVSWKDRKRILRYLIEDVTLTKSDMIHIDVRFKGGATQSLCIPLHARDSTQSRTRAVLDCIRELACTQTDGEIACILNERGFRSPRGHEFTRRRVYDLCRYHKIARLYDHLVDRGYHSAASLIARFGVCKATLVRWCQSGHLTAHRYNDRGEVLYELSDRDFLRTRGYDIDSNAPPSPDVAESGKGV